MGWVVLLLFIVATSLGCAPPGRVSVPEAQPATLPVTNAPEEPAPQETQAEETNPTATSAETAPPTIDSYERGLLQELTGESAPARSRAQAKLALYLVESGRHEEAVPALLAAIETCVPIAPFLRLRLMDAYLATGDPSAAVRTAESILSDSPRSSAAVVARLRLPHLYLLAERTESASEAMTALRGLAIDELNEKDFTDLATALERAGRLDDARQLRLRLLREYSNGRYTETTYAHLAGETPSLLDQMPADEAVQIVSNLARSNRYDQALDLLERLQNRLPEIRTNPLYRSVRVRSLFNSRNYARLLAETTPATLSDAGLLLLRARAAWRDDKPEEFLAGLEDLERRFPKSDEALSAKILRAKYYVTDETDFTRSIANLQQGIDGGAAGTDGENIWNLGWTYTLAGRDAEALRTFDRYLAAYADGDWRTNSLFWSAKIHERNGRLPERDARLRQIIAEYPYSYYAYRAREILGEPLTAPAEIEGGEPFPDIDAQLAQVDPVRLEAVRELMAIGLTRDATREMKALAADYPENLGVAFRLADVFVAGGEPLRANTTLQRRFRHFVRHGGRNVPRRFWEILYPLNFWESIEAEAARRDLDPYLVAAIIRQESAFEPTTVSNAGAVGLMQIMPQEAPRIASLAGIPEMTRERLFDPAENIAVGAAEYSQKLRAMHGNHVLAIAAYNAGEQPVGRWLARTSISDPDTFVESIPYAETRLYVKNVTRSRYEYRRIYETHSGSEQSQ